MFNNNQYKIQLAEQQSYKLILREESPMNISTQSILHSSPIMPIQNILNNPNTPDYDNISQHLHIILQTLQAQKQQFQDRISAQKILLQQKVMIQAKQIQQLQGQMETLEMQCKQLRFNYHQRGSVVDYLKKKVIVIEKKFDVKKEEMLSVIKYLESRNCQLNQNIFQLKNKEQEMNQNLFALQQKYMVLSTEICGNNMTQKQPLKVNTKRVNQRSSLCHKNNSGSITPMTISYKHKNGNNICTDRQFNHISQIFDDSNNESLLAESSIREKTVKYNTALTHARSEDQIDFAQLNHIISLGGSRPSKVPDVQQFPGKGIMINNYGHLSFNDCSGEYRGNVQRKPKHNYVSRPKLSLPNHGRYVTQLNTKRTNKDVMTSIQLQ